METSEEEGEGLKHLRQQLVAADARLASIEREVRAIGRRNG